LKLDTNNKIRVIVIGAHPDEPDIYAGGTAALFAMHGHEVKFLSLTNGCCGHHEQGREELVVRRRAEAVEAAKRLGVLEYEVLDTPDGELLPSIDVRKQVVERIVRWQADIVITFHPEGGHHVDNRYTGKVVSDAAALVVMTPNAAGGAYLKTPPLYLLMPDYSMKSFYSADVVVDIGSVVKKKLLACDAHGSQFYEFAAWQRNILDEVPESGEEKEAFLLKYWSNFLYASDEMKTSLKKWYGAEHAANVTFAEPFEIAQYSRRPSDEEMRTLFPMLRIGG